MALFVLGLVLFLACHSVRIVSEDWRTAMQTRLGEKAYKGIYSLASIVGFVLLVYGFGLVRWDSPMLWAPPMAMRHIAVLLMLVSMVLLVATYVPNNAFKARLHHPMILSVKVWALAHLLANGGLADVVLFGSFLVWSVVLFASSRRRDRREGTRYRPGRLMPTLITLVIGAAAWAGFAFYLHARWIGVHPFA